MGRDLGEAQRGRAMSLCPIPRSLNKTPARNDLKHCHVLIFLIENIKDVINIDIENIHIIQKCKGRTTICPLPQPLEDLPRGNLPYTSLTYSCLPSLAHTAAGYARCSRLEFSLKATVFPPK